MENEYEVKEKKRTGKAGRFFGKLAVIIASGLVFGLCAAVAFGVVEYYTGDIKETRQQTEEFDKEAYKAQIEKEILAKVMREKDREDIDDSVIGSMQNTGEVYAIVTDVTDVVDKVMPSVVSITNNYTATANFWGQVYSEEAQASGSGIIIGENDKELLIATNNHVIADADKLSVQFIDGEEADANVKGADADMDVAARGDVGPSPAGEIQHGRRADHAAHGEHGADGQVDAAGDDDVGHAGRHDAVDGGTAEDVDEVARGKEIVRLQERAEGDDEDEGAERKQLFGEAVHRNNTPELNVSRRRSA